MPDFFDLPGDVFRDARQQGCAQMCNRLSAQTFVELGDFTHDQCREFFAQPGFDLSDDEGVELLQSFGDGLRLYNRCVRKGGGGLFRRGWRRRLYGRAGWRCGARLG